MNIQRVTDKRNEIDCPYLGNAPKYAEPNIPVFEVKDVFAFTKLVGHAKYINAEHGEVLYRGQSQLVFANTGRRKNDQGQKPSAYRGKQAKKDVDSTIEKAIQAVLNDTGNKDSETLESFLHCKMHHDKNAKYIWEALLQHYDAKTRFLDVVDNHWVALWFACHKYDESIKRYRRSRRKYSYIIVFALPTSNEINHDGLFINDQCIVVDLRQACPSTVLRPHMQHAKLFALLDVDGSFLTDYARSISCIIQIRTDLCFDWLGNSALVQEDSLFPCRYKDSMLNLIDVERNDIFDGVMKTLREIK